MDKNKQQLIILGAAILVFIMIVVMKTSKPKQRPSVAPTKAPTATVSPRVEVSKGRITSVFQSWGRDPFAVGSVAESSGDLVLTGIIWDENNPYCIINGKVVKRNDEFSGCKILEIKKDSVTVKVGDEIRILRIGGK